MTSATLAAYQQGTAPLEAQQETVRAYINSIPLAASAGYGDVEGLGDGLWAWYGADVSKVNPLLLAPEKNLSAAQMVNRARALIAKCCRCCWLSRCQAVIWWMIPKY
jgi:hypothetical protein